MPLLNSVPDTVQPVTPRKPADPEGPQTDLDGSDKLCKALDAAMN